MFVASWAGSCLASMAAWVGCSAVSCTTGQILKAGARVAYCFLFTLSMILAWLMRDYGKPLLEKIPWIVKHFTGEPSDAFFGIQAVYRISLGNFLFFGLMSLILLNVKHTSDRRGQFLMSGSPAIKLGFWLVFNAFPFLLPNNVVLFYGYIARVASVMFLIIQLLLLLDFILAVNDAWVQKGEEDERHYKAMLAVTAACYLGCIVLIGFLFAMFKPRDAGSCSFNVSVITLSIVLFVAFTLVSISPLVANGSLFPSAVMSVYTIYLAYSALQSEPHSERCNGLGHKIDAASGTTLAVGMLVTLLSVVYSAAKCAIPINLRRPLLRGLWSWAGSNTSTFTLEDGDGDQEWRLLEEGSMTSAGLDGVPEEQSMDGSRRATQDSAATDRTLAEFKPVSYNYAFFHLVFALASAYIAMLLTGWGEGAEERGLMDIGWASVTMKLLTQWATGLMYMWVLLAPRLLQDREF